MSMGTSRRREENEMNADQLKGRWMQFKGELKKEVGGIYRQRLDGNQWEL
jgi:uncharacterized protein YjbJ (UPF0337 family)